MAEKWTNKSGPDKPGPFEWFVLAYSLVMLMVGVNVGFVLPLGACVWAVAGLRNANPGTRRSWWVYIAVSGVLAVTMFVLWVAFSPSGSGEMIPTESTTWEPVG